MINKILSAVLINALIVYLISKYIPQLWLSVEFFWQPNLEVFFWVWLAFWLINDVLKWLIKILSFPFTLLTLWLFSVIINILMLYLFKYGVNYFDFGVVVWLWNLFQVFLLSIVISLFNLLFKKL